jgi:hypothetical protein
LILPGAFMAWPLPACGRICMHRKKMLSVWWLRLGIQIERIKPGHPRQNGRHERMHLTHRGDRHTSCSTMFPVVGLTVICAIPGIAPNVSPIYFNSSGLPLPAGF